MVANPANVTIAVNGTTGDSGATSFDHQIPFHIGNGYIRYKSVTDGYTVSNNNPYLQFIPRSLDAYNVGGFTWEILNSYDEITARTSGSYRLPAISNVRPYISSTSL